MLVILSQKVDSGSTYSDELFSSYHYPEKYRNQLHKGDIFIYYQGNRYDKSKRYYFGVGTVATARQEDYRLKRKSAFISGQMLPVSKLQETKLPILFEFWLRAASFLQRGVKCFQQPRKHGASLTAKPRLPSPGFVIRS